MVIVLLAVKKYNAYAAEFIIVNSLLTKCLYVYDPKVVEELARRGYKVDDSRGTTRTKAERNEAYAKSIEANFQKLRNVGNKMLSKSEELKKLTGDVEDHKLNFGEMLANVSAGLGFPLPHNITLSEFNQYKKIVKEKHGKK